jgi:hypothetical protein
MNFFFFFFFFFLYIWGAIVSNIVS